MGGLARFQPLPVSAGPIPNALPDGDDDMNEFDGPITDFRGLLHPMNRRRLLQGASALAGAAALGVTATAPEPAYAQDKVLNLLS